MSESKLFLSVDNGLLEEAKQTINVTFSDGISTAQSRDLLIPDSIDITNPYNIDLLQFLPNVNPFTLNIFFNKINELISDSRFNKGFKPIQLTEQYPPDNFQDFGEEVISYKLIWRKRGSVDQNNSVRPQRYRPSYTIRSKKTGDLVEVYNRKLDHLIEFNCWATSNKLANERALWFERLLVSNAWVFKVLGADRFHFEERLADGYMTTGQQKLVYRPLRFFLRFEEFISVNRNEIKNINIITSITSEI